MKAIYNSDCIVPIASISRIQKARWDDKIIEIFLNHAVAGTTNITLEYESKEFRDSAFEGMIEVFEG